MPPVTPRPISIVSVLFGLDLLDLSELHFLHREARRLLGPLHLRRAAALQLLGPLTRDHDKLELVHTRSFRALLTNDPTMLSMTGAIRRGRARSASTMPRSRSTQPSSASLTIT